MTLPEITVHALALHEGERIALARRLLDSVEVSGDPDAETAWAQEIDRRLDALDRGEEMLLEWDEVKRKNRALLEQRAK